MERDDPKKELSSFQFQQFGGNIGLAKKSSLDFSVTLYGKTRVQFLANPIQRSQDP